MSDETRHPVLYFARCGWCGSYEGTVNPNEVCPVDPATGEALGPHQFEVFEKVQAPEDRAVAKPIDVNAIDLPF